jgi:hypothetical protein
MARRLMASLRFWIDGYGEDSSPSPGDSCQSALRPHELFGVVPGERLFRADDGSQRVGDMPAIGFHLSELRKTRISGGLVHTPRNLR